MMLTLAVLTFAYAAYAHRAAGDSDLHHDAGLCSRSILYAADGASGGFIALAIILLGRAVRLQQPY
ncbi:MAG: hypothetical protein MZV63_28860 [Marinilabiliales bacterium]|nr:hypothetical protein [Marinilabiliales bacterium]